MEELLLVELAKCKPCKGCRAPWPVDHVIDGVEYSVMSKGEWVNGEHVHIPVRIDTDWARKNGFKTAPIPDGQITKPLRS
jgi:hypothetical protein